MGCVYVYLRKNSLWSYRYLQNYANCMPTDRILIYTHTPRLRAFFSTLVESTCCDFDAKRMNADRNSFQIYTFDYLKLYFWAECEGFLLIYLYIYLSLSLGLSLDQLIYLSIYLSSLNFDLASMQFWVAYLKCKHTANKTWYVLFKVICYFLLWFYCLSACEAARLPTPAEKMFPNRFTLSFDVS